MYRTSLSFFPLIFLVAACTACTSFYNSNGRRSTRWNRLFSKLPPVTGLMVRVGHSNKKVAKIPRYPEGQMDKEKKFCPAIARIVTLVDHKVLLPLKYYLNMSRVQWQLNGLKKKRASYLVCLWRLAKFWWSGKIRRFFLNWGSHFFYTTFWQIFRLNKPKKRSSATWAFLRRSLQDSVVTWAVYYCSDLSLKRSKVEKTKQKQGAIVPETHFIRLQPLQISRGIIYRATLYNMQNKA